MIPASLRLPLAASLLSVVPLLAADPAKADFRLCNNTSSRVGVAIGYRDKQGWLTEGWWNVAARSCESILKGPLAARFYYVYAVDYDQGGEWSGTAFMCSRDKEFTIRGFENCLARGYNRTGYFEIDTSEQKAWTVQLSEQAQNGAKPKSSAPVDAPPAQPPALDAKPPAPGSAPAAPPTVTTPPVVSPAAPSPLTPQEAPAQVPSSQVPSSQVPPAQPPGGNSPAPNQPAPGQAEPNAPAPTEPAPPGAPSPPQAPQAPATPPPPLPPERPASAPPAN